MAKSGDVLEAPELGIRVEFRRTGAETAGELLEIDVIGRPRGILTQEHVHTTQAERLEVVAGEYRLVLDGVEHVLGPGEEMEVSPGTPHRQMASGAGDPRVRITVRPAGRTDAFLERLTQFHAAGRMTRSGFPRPTAAAELIRDFGDEGHATRPPVAVQRALATAILEGPRAARSAVDVARARVQELKADGQREYVFVDEWDVAAPPEAVFDALADARSYPHWWTPVYLDVEADGDPALGRESRQHFKGRLPYHLRTRSTITRLERPRIVQGDVDGDLRGRGTWTLTPRDGGTHVRFDWRVFADRPLLRTLSPALRRVFRWNHDWAIARARDGLEPYARRTGPPGAEPTGRFRREPARSGDA
jgi:uncharacterized protein YndB with AHSA1/START domain/quercetin dioxygenase-like cupin family protein